MDIEYSARTPLFASLTNTGKDVNVACLLTRTCILFNLNKKSTYFTLISIVHYTGFGNSDRPAIELF